MRIGHAILALPLLAACSKGGGPATFAFDPVWIEPDGEGVHGFETWQLYGGRWDKNYKDKFYVCSVVVEFWGEPADIGDCSRCDRAWQVTPEVMETDCGGQQAEDPGFVSLTRIALGGVPEPLSADDPYPGESMGGFADYGTGTWENHGWAYAEALDTRGNAEDTDWNGEQAFQMWPAFYWDL